MKTCYFGCEQKPITPQTMTGTVERATKITAWERCTKCIQGGAPRLTPLKIGIGYLSLLTLTPERLQKPKVQRKRSVTGDDADGCCPQRKSPCPTLVGRKTKALYGKTD